MTRHEAQALLSSIPEPYRVEVENRLDTVWWLRAIDHAETAIQYAGPDAEKMRELLTELRACREGRPARVVETIRAEIDAAWAASLPLPQVTPARVLELLEAMTTNGSKPATVNRVRNALRAAARDAAWDAAWDAARAAAWDAARDAAEQAERDELARQASDIEQALPEALTAWAKALHSAGESYALCVLLEYGGMAKLQKALEQPSDLRRRPLMVRELESKKRRTA